MCLTPSIGEGARCGGSGRVGAAIDKMTCHDYLLVMSNVRIADLKANLSRHLRAVRSGETITVLDRDTPVARIVPIETTSNGLVIHPPKKPGRLGDVPIPPRPKGLKTDVVALLMEERGDR